MRRRIAIIASALAVAAAIIVTGAWFVFVQQTRQAIERWADTQRRNGVDVSWQALEFAGFPLRIDARFAEPRFATQQAGQTATWTPSSLVFTFSSVAPRAVDFASPGAHEIRVLADDSNWSAHIEAKALDGRAIFPPQDYRRFERLRARMTSVRVSPADWSEPLTIGRGEIETAAPAAQRVDPQAVHPVAASLELGLDMGEIGLPAHLVDGNALNSLGPVVERLAAQVTVLGALNATATDPETLAAWRDSGGTIEVSSLDLKWGPVLISADGTLALDENLQPIGAFATRIAGLEEFITALETTGVLTSNDASVARITLAILTRASDDGGPARVALPVTLQDRILRLGPIALLQVPPIDWR